MTFGLLPHQKEAVEEMVKVTKPGGLVCVGTHGPEHCWEAIDASFRYVTNEIITDDIVAACGHKPSLAYPVK